MQAELDTIHGKPVLRVSVGTRQGEGRYASIDVPLTEEQARQIHNLKETVR